MVLFAFFLASFVLWIQGSIAPALPVLAFSPFLALCCQLRPFHKTLLLACGAGLIVDLLSSDPFGLHSLVYCIAAALSYRMRRAFSAEEAIPFALYTAILSLLATVTQVILLFLFDRRIPFSGQWWISDLALLPLFDALYAIVWFAGPLTAMKIVKKRWMIYWLKRKELSET